MAGLAEPATTALTKLEQVLPWRLRGRINALRTFTASIGDGGPPTDPEVVVFLTGACRDQRRVRFTYVARDGSATEREVEPHRLVQQAPVEVVARRVPPVVPVERVDDARCRVYATGESAYAIAVNLLLIDQDLTVEDTSPQVLEALRLLGDRITAATRSSAQ